MHSLFAPHVQKFVEEIIRNGKIGISAGNIAVIHAKSGCSNFEKKPLCDRFKIVIPYGGQSVTWEILFHALYPELPPDFIFDDGNFKPDINDIESLCNWNPDDPASLIQVIQQLLEKYRWQEVMLLEDYSRLQFEYSSLIHQAGFSDTDVEVLLNRKNRNGPVNFLIRLPIDFSKLPPFLTKDNPGDDSAVLLVTFQTPDGSRITPQLYLSPRVEQALGGNAALRIPSFSSAGCLMDYVPLVRQLLSNKIEQIVVGFEKRKEYVAAFLSHYGRSIVEYEAESFSKLSLMFEWNDFYFLLHINIPLYFPQDKPSFMFQSIYHANLGRPYSVICNDYPYSPRWSGNEMAERAQSFLLDYVPKFQRSSIENKS